MATCFLNLVDLRSSGFSALLWFAYFCGHPRMCVIPPGLARDFQQVHQLLLSFSPTNRLTLSFCRSKNTATFLPLFPLIPPAG